MRPSPQRFEPHRHERELLPILREIRAAETFDPEELHRLVRRYPKEGRGAFSKSEILRGYRYFRWRRGWDEDEGAFVEIGRAHV